MFWTIITWIILGALAGWIASIITGTNNRVNGWMNVGIGILGAFIGGLALQLFGIPLDAGFNVSSLLTAVAGAVILLLVMRAFRSDSL